MHVYRAPLSRFLTDVEEVTFGASLARSFEEVAEQAPSPGEQLSWNASLPRLADVLREARFLESEIFVELRMPLCSRRADAVLTGRNDEGRHTAVVVELKQWETVGAAAYDEHVSVGHKVLQHPSAQARDYLHYLKHFHTAFHEEGVQLAACAFLHNMSGLKPLAFLRNPDLFGRLPHDYPVFGANDLISFREFLAGHLLPGPGRESAERVVAGRARPSEKLLDVVVEAVKGEREWKLLDEQRKTFVVVTTEVRLAKENGQKAVVIVRGGPGTGKSVLAIQLLAFAAQQHWRVVHATGTRAFNTVLKAKTLAFADQMVKGIFNARRKSEVPVDGLFTTFANVAREGARTENAFDLVVADEAHRLWDFRKSQPPNGRPKLLSTTPMVREFIQATRVAAFFLDENQSVRSGEIGSAKVIREEAERLGAKVIEIDLNLQFRCAGSESYTTWVDGSLSYTDRFDLAWRAHDGYEFAVCGSMQEMEQRLNALRAQAYRCRYIAGYCWRWSKPKGNGMLVPDVSDPRFRGWQAPWIEKTGRNLKPLDDQYFRWATNEALFDQVGSIYSAQGFEFDYVGVIFGEDLVIRDGKWVAQLDRNKDRSFKRDLATSGEAAEDKLRNIYRVLLTRGMQGTFVYFLDAETRAHFERMLASGGLSQRRFA